MPSILSFPAEIVAEIFQWTITRDYYRTYYIRNHDLRPNYYRNLAYRSLRQDQAPVNIACVCRGWRQIALAQACLWAYFEIDAFTTEGVQCALSRMQTWLKRSSSFNRLSFEVMLHASSEESVDEAFRDAADTLFRELNEHKNRWEDVHFHLRGVFADALSLDALPKLQKLQYEAKEMPPLRLDLTTIPMLRHVSLSGPLVLSATPSNLILTSLAVLRLDVGVTRHSLTTDDYLTILRCTPHLKELRLTIGTYGLKIPKDCIRLPKLEYLAILWTEPGHGERALKLLHGFDAPFLASLSVKFPDSFPSDDYEEEVLADVEISVYALQHFISRCNAPLADLEIYIYPEELDITNLLRLTPDLKKLFFRCGQLPTNFYGRLSSSKHKVTGEIRPPLCPRLESIFLDETEYELDHECGLPTPLDPKMVKMVRQRWNVPEAERTLRAFCHGSLDLRRSKKLEKMRSEGLDLDFSGYRSWTR